MNSTAMNHACPTRTSVDMWSVYISDQQANWYPVPPRSAYKNNSDYTMNCNSQAVLPTSHDITKYI